MVVTNKANMGVMLYAVEHVLCDSPIRVPYQCQRGSHSVRGEEIHWSSRRGCLNSGGRALSSTCRSWIYVYEPGGGGGGVVRQSRNNNTKQFNG